MQGVKGTLAPHGTITRYLAGCRCGACKARNTARGRAYRARPEIQERLRNYRRSPKNMETQRTRQRRPDVRAKAAKRQRIRRTGDHENARATLAVVQKGTCAGCLRFDPTNLRLDHDHGCCSGRQICGQCIRGLLCNDCNIALGLLRDNPETLRRLADYVEQNRNAA